MTDQGHPTLFESTLCEFVKAAIDRDLPAPRTFPEVHPREIREGAGYLAREFAEALMVTPATIRNWEKGVRGQGPEWRAYCHLLHHLENRGNPEPATAAAPAHPPAGIPAPRTALPSPAVPAPATPPQTSPPLWSEPAAPAVPRHTALPRGHIGSVAVLSAATGGFTVHLPDGRSGPCPVTGPEDLPHLAARLGLSPWTAETNSSKGPHRRIPPVLALTASATAALGLPPTCHGPHQDTAAEILDRIGRDGAGRTVGAWSHLGLPNSVGLRLLILPWTPAARALAELPTPTDTARMLGEYTRLVMPPAAPPGYCGIDLMGLMRPELAANSFQDPFLGFPGPARTGVRLWARTPSSRELKRDCVVVALRTTLPFANAASSDTRLPSAQPRHFNNPAFDRKRAGRWLVDLSGFPHDERLPFPFTVDGRPSAGPDWYPTAAVAYAAQRLEVRPIEGWLCPDGGKPYLVAWYERLRDAQIAVLDRTGVSTEHRRDAAPEPARMLADLLRMREHADPVDLALLDAIAVTEAEAVLEPVEGEPGWAAYAREELLARAASNLHRKLLITSRATLLFPLAVTPQLVLYSAPSPDVFHVIARERLKDAPASFSLGARPGGVQPAGHAALADYADLLACLRPDDPAAPALLNSLFTVPGTR
ncbi:helix-turn-helix domain-containing protein [Kitasatospora sp. NPDC059795]|uniref:helix-turn-helix domain-containing protein n=1 Tax=Kitasatospora sp. NPDC059795 TaxID=3346949 RepID=UPI00365F3B71